MDASAFYRSIVVPNANVFPKLDSPEARCFLLSIAGVETDWTQRIQRPIAYAHGFWQFEKHGACLALMTNRQTSGAATALCKALGVTPTYEAVFNEIIMNDRLAYGLARLLLLPDPAPLPDIGDEAETFAYYVRTWNPGKPGVHRWASVYQASVAAVSA